jgi:hypothetical protein
MEHSRLIGIIQQAAGYQTTEYAHKHNQQSGGGKGNGNKDKKAQFTAAAATTTTAAAAGVETVAAAESAAPAAPVSAKKTAGPPLVVADMMAGVGPFAVPLAMPLVGTTNSVTTAERTIVVHANGKPCLRVSCCNLRLLGSKQEGSLLTTHTSSHTPCSTFNAILCFLFPCRPEPGVVQVPGGERAHQQLLRPAPAPLLHGRTVSNGIIFPSCIIL